LVHRSRAVFSVLRLAKIRHAQSGWQSRITVVCGKNQHRNNKGSKKFHKVHLVVKIKGKNHADWFIALAVEERNLSQRPIGKTETMSWCEVSKPSARDVTAALMFCH
jgi:hypothetical protein